MSNASLMMLVSNLIAQANADERLGVKHANERGRRYSDSYPRQDAEPVQVFTGYRHEPGGGASLVFSVKTADGGQQHFRLTAAECRANGAPIEDQS